MAKTIKTTFKLRRGTATEWLAANPILNQGEPGFEIDTNKLKIGNGMDRWNKLEYIAGEASEDASGGGAAEIYIGTTAPTGKYKLWINPEGEISEGGMGGTGDYGKETKTTKSKIIGPETEDNWDIDIRDDIGIDGYISIQIEPPEDIMTTGEEFSFTFNFNNREPIVFSDVVEEISAYDQLIKYIGKVEMLFSEDISLFDGSNYAIALGEENGEFSMVGMFSLTESDMNDLQNIEFKWSSVDYIKLPVNALTEGTHIKINQENTQINCTIGEPIGISKWKTFGVGGVSSASIISKYSNNYLYTLQGSYGDKYLTPYNSTHAFEITSEAYTSSPQFYYSSAIARNTNNLATPNRTDSFYSQTQSNQYKIFIDYMTPNGETITIDCKGLGYEDQNTIDEFNSLFNLNNQNLNYFFGRYNTLTPAYNISKGIVPEDDNEESFFIIFIFAEKWTNCIPILLTDKTLNDSERQIFSDNINQPLYDRISLRSLSDENNLFVNGDDNGLILGYSNIYSGDQNIIFGSSNKFLAYGTKNIIFGDNNTIDGHYGIIFGHSNTFSGCANIVNVGRDNKLYKVDNIGAIGNNLNTSDNPYTTLITGHYNAYLSAYYGSSLFNPGADIFQVGGGNDQQRLNAFGVRSNCCYRQEYNSNGSFAYTFKIWDDKMKLPSMSSGTTTAELIQALISAGIMEGGNE